MNKKKIAVFVEGQAEYIFVRDFLNCWYGYDADKLGIECLALHAEKLNKVPYPVGNRDSENFYQIVNVGNDRSVISKMIKESERLNNVGFQLIVGLSDMYGDDYHRVSHNRIISNELNVRFMQARQESIERSPQKDKLRFHFAIMEVEAWILGMHRALQRIDSKLTPEWIAEQLHINIMDDPEKTYYHPALVLDNVYGLAGKKYGKHEGDIYQITSVLSKEDYVDLLNSGRCPSFKTFIKELVDF